MNCTPQFMASLHLCCDTAHSTEDSTFHHFANEHCWIWIVAFFHPHIKKLLHTSVKLATTDEEMKKLPPSQLPAERDAQACPLHSLKPWGDVNIAFKYRDSALTSTRTQHFCALERKEVQQFLSRNSHRLASTCPESSVYWFWSILFFFCTSRRLSVFLDYNWKVHGLHIIDDVLTNDRPSVTFHLDCIWTSKSVLVQ